MSKAKSVFSCIGVTIFIWAISRFIPSLVRVTLESNTTLILLTYIVALPTGWALSRAITKGKHAQCIRVNLYIFAIFEMLGVCDVLNYLLQELSFYTGRYSTDAYGVAYSDYISIYGVLLLLEISYIVICFLLAKKTPSPKADNRTTVDSLVAETPELSPSLGEDTTAQTDETCYYMEAANGMTVRVPESRLEAWQTEQDRIRNNPDAAKLTETEKQLVDAIVRDIYGPKDAHITSTESTSTIETIQKSNQRYCRLCGGAIDLKSRKCTKCGKQYFSLQLTLSKLKKPFLATLVLVLIASNIYLTVSLLNTQRDVAVYQEEVSILTNDKLAYEERISDLLFQLDDLRHELSELSVQMNAAQKKNSFYDRLVVFAYVNKTSSGVEISYHKYDCPTFQRLISSSGLIFAQNAVSADVQDKLTCTYCRD